MRAAVHSIYPFGPHTVDLCSLDSNAMCDDSGEMLKHFTPFPSPMYVYVYVCVYVYMDINHIFINFTSF